jgi:hypothetical protein
MERRSILEITAGELVNRLDEPYLDLCAGCADRLIDWLRGGRQTAASSE